MKEENQIFLIQIMNRVYKDTLKNYNKKVK